MGEGGIFAHRTPTKAQRRLTACLLWAKSAETDECLTLNANHLPPITAQIRRRRCHPTRWTVQGRIHERPEWERQWQRQSLAGKEEGCRDSRREGGRAPEIEGMPKGRGGRGYGSSEQAERQWTAARRKQAMHLLYCVQEWTSTRTHAPHLDRTWCTQMKGMDERRGHDDKHSMVGP
ncbi:hypothetical protein WOLCODRAFT_167876 [Wolfiporia cocos MD-104 SS10]|uniref:Uncharacterized protein n=1 Tax=Wolfiporia cocos (strain MD-104) TaxID=742152 RepID=A0A2H3JKF9_WOLCO|nr:hypothetical protein WOLCODRAFT_167876 [Wolfiporia cocos MD-104 SS10]